jgi:hypothetical protein
LIQHTGTSLRQEDIPPTYLRMNKFSPGCNFFNTLLTPSKNTMDRVVSYVLEKVFLRGHFDTYNFYWCLLKIVVMPSHGFKKPQTLPTTLLTQTFRSKGG